MKGQNSNLKPLVAGDGSFISHKWTCRDSLVFHQKYHYIILYISLYDVSLQLINHLVLLFSETVLVNEILSRVMDKNHLFIFTLYLRNIYSIFHTFCACVYSINCGRTDVLHNSDGMVVLSIPQCYINMKPFHHSSH